MSIKIAKFLRVVRDDDIRQLLWVDSTGEYLVTSSTSENGETSANETCLFRANEHGDIGQAEAVGCVFGIGNHGFVLSCAGYRAVHNG